MKKFLRRQYRDIKKALFGSTKDKCAVPKFDPTGHNSRTAMYGKHGPALTFTEHERKERAPILLSISRETFTLTNVPFRQAQMCGCEHQFIRESTSAGRQWL
jgi:hypothetical protein